MNQRFRKLEAPSGHAYRNHAIGAAYGDGKRPLPKPAQKLGIALFARQWSYGVGFVGRMILARFGGAHE